SLATVTWLRFVIAFLNKRGWKSYLLNFAGWFMLITAMVGLMANRFYFFIFSFNDQHEYVSEPGRFLIYIMQILVFLVTSLYMLYRGFHAGEAERVRYFAVGVATLLIDIFEIHQILFPFMAFNAMGFLFGICVVHSFVESGNRKEKVTYDNIARSLAGDYEAIYYIDLETGAYNVFSTSDEHDSLKAPSLGKDFFVENRINAGIYAHPDDREYAQSWYYKDKMLEALEGRWSFSFKYRIRVGEEMRFFLFTVMRVDDGKHLILCEKDIQDEITAESVYQETKKRSVTYSRIMESLATNYDVIYYVDAVDSSYTTFETQNIFGTMDLHESGKQFFEESQINIPKVVHRKDRELVMAFINRDHLLSSLERHKSCSIDYTLTVDGKMHYARMTARKTSDGTHFIIGVENIDAEVRKEKKALKALNNEKELARRDELTGIKNKTAYMELEKSVQDSMEKDEDDLAFAIVVCDANDLKKVNDTEGHVAGDEYIKASAMLLCDIFDHSPVFRVGGDEFAVYLTGSDYKNRRELLAKLRAQSVANRDAASGPVLASGMAEYSRETDAQVSEVFDRADKEMYKNKQLLKGNTAETE
ncbi:MAG: diguanylate cyclase, partial [Lachnospiraceae bacterium]|nr:diguanylate cyclase [Lachnospiraceae bacterium]